MDRWASSSAQAKRTSSLAPFLRSPRPLLQTHLQLPQTLLHPQQCTLPDVSDQLHRSLLQQAQCTILPITLQSRRAKSTTCGTKSSQAARLDPFLVSDQATLVSQWALALPSQPSTSPWDYLEEHSVQEATALQPGNISKCSPSQQNRPSTCDRDHASTPPRLIDHIPPRPQFVATAPSPPVCHACVRAYPPPHTSKARRTQTSHAPALAYRCRNRRPRRPVQTDGSEIALFISSLTVSSTGTHLTPRANTRCDPRVEKKKS